MTRTVKRTPSRSSLRRKSQEHREMLFVEWYLVYLNASKAAIKAGYSRKSANVIGHDLIHRPHIGNMIKLALEERRKRIHVSQDNVIHELSTIAFSDIANVLEHKGRSIKLRDLESIPPDKRACIASIEKKRYGVKVKFYDKVAALDKLGQHLNLWIRDHDPINIGIMLGQGDNGFGNLTPEQEDIEINRRLKIIGGNGHPVNRFPASEGDA